MCYLLFIHLSVDGPLGRISCLAIMDNDVRHTCVQIFVWTCFHFPWLYTYKWISGSVGNCTFNIFRTFQTLCRRDHTVLQPQEQCMWIPVSLYPLHAVLPVFSVIAILGCEVLSPCGLTCICSMANDVVHLVTCWSERYLFKYPICFKIGVFDFCFWAVQLLYIFCIQVSY